MTCKSTFALCVLMSEMNERMIPAACEVDLGNAILMHALSQASGNPPMCLDWNNNYTDDENKCILFHCGSVPRSLMSTAGTVSSHAILSNAPGICSSYGCNVGRIKPMPFTFGSMSTDAGTLKLYLGEGEFTDDAIPEDFFGCAGVASISGLQDVMVHIVRHGHKHHVSIAPGQVFAPMKEALERYLGCDVALPQINR